MKVICISGKARHGKDTLAGMLNEHLKANGHRVLIAHFGDLVKYICEKFFAWDGAKDEKGRTLLQYVGTDVVRTQRPSYWTDFIVSVLQLFPNEWDYVLIPDCRFPNEVECFRENNIDTMLIRINRPDFASDLTPEQANHPSETAMDNYHFVDMFVINNGSLQDLSNKVEEIAKYL